MADPTRPGSPPDPSTPAGRSDPAGPGASPPPAATPPWSPFPATESWLERRRRKVVEEIARNRRGEYTVPTWVLAAALGLILAAWATLIIVS
ncbi:hypothetical protein O7623_04930 [Solwaraspora sp. WMMD791]|uniref:hypothetical protein n=1 Tax=Solwaraspora sp. WMMD791 TaxID=3016086 RepID=UPI002499F38E|nr:hypothetical protein [Solwaraspora sp. WMMD791]WFE30881.1 hypothetical protein O7623_04930 [Solwaraspora sp. WMMD791]